MALGNQDAGMLANEAAVKLKRRINQKTCIDRPRSCRNRKRGSGFGDEILTELKNRKMGEFVGSFFLEMGQF